MTLLLDYLYSSSTQVIHKHNRKPIRIYLHCSEFSFKNLPSKFHLDRNSSHFLVEVWSQTRWDCFVIPLFYSLLLLHFVCSESSISPLFYQPKISTSAHGLLPWLAAFLCDSISQLSDIFSHDSHYQRLLHHKSSCGSLCSLTVPYERLSCLLTAILPWISYLPLT